MVWQRSCLDANKKISDQARSLVEELAAWWDQYATTSVAGNAPIGLEMVQSAREVVAVLEERQATAPVPLSPVFWRDAVADFSSARTHAAAADALGKGF